MNIGMFLAKIVFAAFTCTVTNYVFVAGQEENIPEETENSPEEEKTTPPQDNHTFVALIDIVFTDGRKRSCTGTIIHDYVVVTAAHCFSGGSSNVEPELTASFVVIGTKKMYDSGYENYLPIERVITHPNYRGWTADIALVYTFAGMTSDKPGNIIPIIGESAMTPVDSNVTVLSWGHCKEETPPAVTHSPLVVPTALSSDERITDISCEPKNEPKSTSAPSNLRNQAYASESDTDDSSEESRRLPSNRAATGRLQLKEAKSEYIAKHPQAERMALYKESFNENQREPTEPNIGNDDSSSYNDEVKSNPEEVENPYTVRHRYNKVLRKSSKKEKPLENLMVVINTEDLNFKVHSDRFRRSHRIRRSAHGDSLRRNLLPNTTIDGRKSFMDNVDKAEQNQAKTENSIQTYFKNWRRQMGSKQNTLMVEIFGFVNVQTCKKLVEKAMPLKFAIVSNQVVCFATEEHYITDEDSGAPAIRQGHLVAVTVGGVECEGDHVAIGMKMSCFCSWIAENLPDGAGANMKCCKDCCNGKNGEEKRYKQLKHKTKYL